MVKRKNRMHTRYVQKVSSHLIATKKVTVKLGKIRKEGKKERERE